MLGAEEKFSCPVPNHKFAGLEISKSTGVESWQACAVICQAATSCEVSFKAC